MEHQLLPARDIAPSLPEDISAEDSVRAWIDLMKSAEKFVMAGLASRVGAQRARAHYRQWYADTVSRHARHMVRLAKRLRQAGAN